MNYEILIKGYERIIREFTPQNHTMNGLRDF